MDYATLRRELNSTKKSISSIRNKKMQLEQELKDLSLEKEKARNAYRQNYSTEKQNALARHKEEVLKPLEEERAHLEDELHELRLKHDHDLGELTVDNLMEHCSSKQDILNEVKESVNNLHGVIVDAVGERFCKELESQLDVKEVPIDESKLEEIVAYFNICSSEITKISQKGNRLTTIISSAQNALLKLDGSNLEGNTGATVVLIVALSVILLLCYKFVFPYYVLFLLFIGAVDMYRNYKVLRIIMSQKIIRDNVDAIEDMLHKQVLEELNKRTEQVNSEFEEKQSALEQQQQAINDDIVKKAELAERSYVFDEQGVVNSYNVAIRQKETRENEINLSIRESDKELEQAYTKLESLQAQLDDIVGSIQEEFLNFDKIGTEYEMDPKFIVDVEKSKPVFFNHPMKSTMFLYNEETDVINFIRLLIVQLRVHLNPNSFTVDVYDPTTLGSGYLCFKPSPKDDREAVLLNKLLHIATSREELKEMFVSYNAELGRRFTLIMSGYDSLTEYNRFMLSNQSLPEPMKFVFIQDPDPKIFEDLNVIQLLRNAAKIGYYFHIFMRKDRFFNLNEQTKAIIEVIGGFYFIEDSKILPRAKDFVSEQVELANQKQ